MLDEAGLAVVLIGLGTPDEAHAFRISLRLPFPVLSDSDQRIYQLFGLGHIADSSFTFSDIGPLARDILRHGGAFSRSQDMAQLGGTVVVDQRGVICFIHRSQRIADNSQAADLAAAFGCCQDKRSIKPVSPIDL